jgi:hypothetical protein
MYTNMFLTHIICTEKDPTLVVHDCGDVCEAWCEAQVRPAANSGDKWIFVDQKLDPVTSNLGVLPLQLLVLASLVHAHPGLGCLSVRCLE